MSKKHTVYQFLPYDVSHFEEHRVDPTGSSSAVTSARDSMAPNAKVLYDRAVIPPALRDSLKDMILFKKGVTTMAKGKDHFQCLEYNYMVFVLNNMHAREYDRSEMRCVHRYVSQNMLGTNDEPLKDDTIYWENGYNWIRPGFPAHGSTSPESNIRRTYQSIYRLN